MADYKPTRPRRARLARDGSTSRPDDDADAVARAKRELAVATTGRAALKFERGRRRRAYGGDVATLNNDRYPLARLIQRPR